MRHSLLPDVVMWPLVVLGAVIFVLLMLQRDAALVQWPVEALLGLLPVTGFYGLLYAASGGRLIGFGDVKLGIFMGLVLGWQGALMALLLANYLGFAWVAPALIRRKLKKDSRMPFGPFLIVATLLVFLWGETLKEWLFTFLAV
jgi:prepilin signal peptidase PulO-like enzyme (type II secretory pathway)